MFDLFQILQNGVPHVSAAALFFILFFGAFASEDAACLLAGSATASGRISFAAALSACFFGIFAGDVLLYGAGRTFGPRIFASRIVKRLVSDATVEKASSWLERNGASAVFVSRFVSGLRLPTYLLAGSLRTDFLKFTLYFFLAAAIWTPLLVASTAFAQGFVFPKNSLVGLLVLAVVLRLVFKYSLRKNRRLFAGRLKRVLKWEFWPLQVFYVPVVLYVLWLGISKRSLTAFTAANPGIPAGGFKGESKDEIYRGLSSSKAAATHMLRHILLRRDAPIDEWLRQAWKFVDENALSYPLVLKPNAGERGRGVRILRSESELENEMLAADADLVLQEFAAGEEVSVFYYRYPNQKQGPVFSITEKRFPVLSGDGVSTLEELILNDSRAICLAEKYFEQNQERLGSIPEKGKAVKLIDIGTHSRGAIFLDGGWLRTTDLEKRIDEICRGFSEFYFGRFDIRAASFDDLMRGENFKIIELNGVTSESTNIYDPRYSLIDAYRILFAQWRIAFEIGVENIKRGVKTTGVIDLMRFALGVPAAIEPRRTRPESIVPTGLEFQTCQLPSDESQGYFRMSLRDDE